MALVQPIGPAFADAFGYIKADQRVQLNGDGKSGRITAKTDLLAPNLVTKGNPDSSWKQLTRLDADATVTILGTVQGSRDSVYKVSLPAQAEAFVNLAYLRPASADEISAHESRIGKPSTAKPAASTEKKPEDSKKDVVKEAGRQWGTGTCSGRQDIN